MDLTNRPSCLSGGVFCYSQIMPDFVINRKAPIIMGVEILDGQLKMGTPICVPSKEVSKHEHIMHANCLRIV